MDGATFRFDGFEFDTARFELRSAGSRVPIEPRAFDVLQHLIAHRDRVVSKEELLDTLWGDRFVGEAALTTALRTARNAIGDSGREQRLIRTVLRRGYQFVGEVIDEIPEPAVDPNIDETAETADEPMLERVGNPDGEIVTETVRSGSRPDGANALPARLMQTSGLGFAGRGDECARLDDVCKEVIASGQRQVVLVSGEAGVGKTTLCSVVAATAHSNGAVVAYGRCDEELSIPYQPWREVLAGLERDSPDSFTMRRTALAPLLAGFDTAAIDSDSARFALYGAMVDVLDAATDDGRLALVVLDDLHWADAETIALLRHVTLQALTTPLLVIATFRDSDIDAGHPLSGLLATTHREPGTARLELQRLDDDELLTLLETLAGHDLGDDGVALRDALRAETEGNPFFVTEILRHLTETGAISQHTDGRWSAATDLRSKGLPISVREVVGRRVERLGDETRGALDTASIIGREFDLGLLAKVLGEEPARTFERLEPAIDTALVSDAGGRFAFSHAIVAHTLYDALGGTARAFGHESVASALERSAPDGRAGEVAHHWMRSIGAHGRSKAAEWAGRAGDDALARLAPDEAVNWYRHALELLADDDAQRRCDALVGLGIAQRQAGRAEYRETLLDASRRAIELGDDDLLVRAALANNRGEVSDFGAVDDERIEILQQAIAARPTGPDGALLHAILGIEMHDGSDHDVEATTSRAIEVARETGDDRTMVRVVRLAESALRVPDALAVRERWLDEGIAAAERSGDPLLRGMMEISHHEIALERGDRDAMDTARDARDAFSERSPEPFVRWTNEQTRWTHLFLDGDLDGAEAVADATFEIGVATGQPEAFFAYAGHLFQLRRAQGRLGEIADQLEQFAAENPTLRLFGAALAHMYCELGRESDARRLADHIDPSRDDAPHFWSTSLMLWADVCHTLSLTEPAARIAPILDRWRHQVASTGASTEGAIAHGLGLALATLGRVDEAAAAYETALTVNRGLRAPMFVARSQLAYADLLATIEPARARDLATEARSAAERYGFSRLVRRTGDLLARLD